ncbi:hypothetical protein I551_9134 [Mycobacterium ulcerans str. Harvey]|uniref:Uncharacterized protein n=1 Tax=Mycobacterium ulcerans str. Harvey TaxID=1299332 RepID=A0ABN0R9P0_MYCUL|nr:hypothetical protein I551_9134 [Mycobacterium ulcerans str. Harvey]
MEAIGVDDPALDAEVIAIADAASVRWAGRVPVGNHFAR